MNSGYYYRGGMAFMSVLISAASLAEPLLHDPFTRPVLSAVVANGADTPLKPRLIAVMVAGNKSLVNLDGTIIGIGEEKDGYRLVKVEDHKAIFTKSKKHVVLEMEMFSEKQSNERGSQ